MDIWIIRFSEFEWLNYTGYLHILPGNGRPAPWSFMEQTREFRIETRSRSVGKIILRP